MQLKQIIWAITNEPKRVWQWWHRHYPPFGKRIGFIEACRAVCENPPCFDLSWDEDVEPELKKVREGNKELARTT